jgi:uncharacterized protein DUF6632
MLRERALKVILVLVGLLFTAAAYPVIDSLLHGAGPSDYGDDMMMSLYFVLGIFLMIAVRNPGANRSLIAFAAWSSFAHAAVMTTLGLQHASERTGFVGGSAALVVIGVALIALAPAKATSELMSAVRLEVPTPEK